MSPTRPGGCPSSFLLTAESDRCPAWSPTAVPMGRDNTAATTTRSAPLHQRRRWHRTDGMGSQGPWGTRSRARATPRTLVEGVSTGATVVKQPSLCSNSRGKNSDGSLG
jgi:hypothetical protein